MKNHKSKRRWSRKAVGILACAALTFSLLPVGALVAFGESEAVIEALNVIKGTDTAIAKDTPAQETEKVEKKDVAEDKTAADDKQVADKDENEANTGSQSDGTGNPAAEDEQDEAKTDEAVQEADSVSISAAEEKTEEPKDEAQEPSANVKAFKNAYDAAVAASEDGDNEALAEKIALAKELYAMLDADEKADTDITEMWGDIQAIEADMPEEIEVTDPVATVNGKGYETLQAAINEAPDGSTITIDKDFELTTYISITKSLTLNLNGKTITESGDKVIAVSGGSVAISNGSLALSAGSGTYALSVTGGSLSLQGVAVNGNGASGVFASDGATLAVNGGSIDCAQGFGIRVLNGANATLNGGSINAQNGVFVANNGSTFTLNDGSINGSQYGIVGNGQSQYGGTTINVKGGSVSSSEYIGIYHPQAGTLNVSGGSVQGPLGGIGIKSGTLNITGGTIAGTTGANYDGSISSHGNGIMVTGSAIHIDSRSGYAGNLAISISGGTLSSANGYAIHEVSDGGSTIGSLSIKGGTFFAAGDIINMTAASSSAVSVSGGRFNHEIPSEYCPDGYGCTAVDNGYTIARNYANNVSYADGTDAGSNTIVFDDSVTLEMVSIPDAFDPENGEATWTWRTSFKVTAPEDMLEEGKTPTYSYIANAHNDDGNSDNWVSGGALPEDNVFYIDANPSQMTGKNQLSYRFAFDWNGDGDIDQYVTAILKDTVVFADHECDWTDFVVTTEPTCLEAGVQKRQCRIGGEEDSQPVDALGHDWSEEEDFLDPTCLDPGETLAKCQREGCDAEQFTEIAPLGHDWKDVGVILDPTCEDEGASIEACTRAYCGLEIEHLIAPTGHSYGAAIVTKDATCTEAGVATRTCSVCNGTEETVIDALGHKEVAVADKAATCTETGYEGRTECSVCHEVVNAGTEIAMLEHRLGNGVTQREATCTTDGLITFSCPDCGVEVSTERIPAKGHAEITVGATDPTCTTAGSTGARVCQDCDAVITAASEIPATGHSFGEWTVLTAAQVGVPGIEQHVCTVCNTPETRAIAALPAENNGDNGTTNNGGNAAVNNSGNNGGNGPVDTDEGDNGTPSSPAAGSNGGSAAANAGGNGGNALQGDAVTGGAAVAEGAAENAVASEGEQIADDVNPLASSNITRQSKDEIDWLLVGIAAAAFVIVDGLAIGAFLVWRRRKLNI